MFPEFMFAHAMEERLMAYTVLERLRDIGIKTIPLEHIQVAVATLVGNLEWRDTPSVLALFLPHVRPMHSASGEPEDGTASRLNLLLRFQSHVQVASLPGAINAGERILLAKLPRKPTHI